VDLFFGSVERAVTVRLLLLVSKHESIQIPNVESGRILQGFFFLLGLFLSVVWLVLAVLSLLVLCEVRSVFNSADGSLTLAR
jgi:hypothetical protein